MTTVRPYFITVAYISLRQTQCGVTLRAGTVCPSLDCQPHPPQLSAMCSVPNLEGMTHHFLGRSHK